MSALSTEVRESGSKLVATIKSPEFQEKFKDMLPPDVPVGKFTSVLVRAVQEQPDLMKPTTDKNSLLLSCQKAAQDGLIPDGREGALVMYGNKVQWQPMIGGLRKRIAKHGWDLRADLVFENDLFDYDMGDEPRITHKAPPLGQERGKLIGAYAIAKNTDGRIMREVMGMKQLDDVKAVSRSKSSGPWAGPFAGEMHRKTVARRLIKQLPLVDDDARLASMLKHDEEGFDLDKPKVVEAPKLSPAAQKVQEAVRAAKAETTAHPPAPEGEVIEAEFEELPPGDGPGAPESATEGARDPLF